MVASPRAPDYFPDHMSLNSAWRRTLTHLIVVAPFGDDTPGHLVDTVYADITYNKTHALRQLSPETGVYFNEADSYEPDWQQAFWGEGYAGLKELKRKIDPDNVLWCRMCVGSEALAETVDGKLCKVYEGRGHDEL
jgi:hypothetical protein